MVHADATGVATFTYTGVEPGRDAITASSTVGTSTLTSPERDVTWTPGKHVTFLSLNQTQSQGVIGKSVTLQASLTDITANPPTGISSQTITVTVGSETCNATTDASGNASCTVTLGGQRGSQTVTASYAGTSQYTASLDSEQFTAIATLPTTLVADPAIANIESTLTINFPNLVAHLSAAGKPVRGEAISFTTTSGTAICTGVTDATGTAKCNGSLTAILSLGLGYTAKFAGDSSFDGQYLPATAHGSLITVEGIPVT
jgi:hypothetical protein